MSFAMWPYGASELLPYYRVFMRTSESPSNLILSKPSSKANSNALLATKALTSMTVGGNRMSYDKETMGSHSKFRMIRPIPALFLSLKIVPSSSWIERQSGMFFITPASNS